MPLAIANSDQYRCELGVGRADLAFAAIYRFFAAGSGPPCQNTVPLSITPGIGPVFGDIIGISIIGIEKDTTLSYQMMRL